MAERDIYSNSGRMNYGDGFYDDDKPVDEEFEEISLNEEDYEEAPQPGKKKKKKKRRVLKFILGLLGILLVIIVIYLIVVLIRIHYTGESPDHSVAEEAGIELQSKFGVENILLFGEDNHQDGEYGRADSIILLTIDNNNHQLKQTSFMRDIYLTIPGYGMDKLNAAYSYGGPKLAAETIEYNFGIKIDNYMIVDFNSFTDIVDSLGGIELELTDTEIDYINWQSYRNKQTDDEQELNSDDYDFYENDDGDYVALVHLNGRQALWYARDRDSAGSDFDRTSRQRIVIDTIISKFKTAGPLRLMYAGFSVSPYLTTNMNPFSLTGDGFNLIIAFLYERLEFRTPTNDNYYNDWNDSGQVLVISDDDLENQRLYHFIFESGE